MFLWPSLKIWTLVVINLWDLFEQPMELKPSSVLFLQNFLFFCWCLLVLIFFYTGLEIMGPAYRTFAGMMICLFFAVALMILAGLAYIFNSWFQLALVTSVPFVVLFRYNQKYNRRRSFLQYQNFSFLFYLGLSDSFPQIKDNIIKVVQS